MIYIVLTSAAEIERRVLLYQSLGGGFLILGCVCLGISVVLFFSLRIVKVVSVKTGQARRLSIRQMEKSKEEQIMSLRLQEEWRTTGETAKLGQEDKKNIGQFVILRDITLLHTEEYV